MYAIRWLDIIIDACAQLLFAKKQPRKSILAQLDAMLPERSESDASGLWQAAPPVCITAEGPVFNTHAYGSYRVQWGIKRGLTLTRSSIGPMGECPTKTDKCVPDVTRSDVDCKHVDVYAAPFPPEKTLIDPSSSDQKELWQSIDTIVLCLANRKKDSPTEIVKLHSGNHVIACVPKDERCHYCAVGDIDKFTSQPFYWEGKSANFIFGLHSQSKRQEER